LHFLAKLYLKNALIFYEWGIYCNDAHTVYLLLHNHSQDDSTAAAAAAAGRQTSLQTTEDLCEIV